LAGAERIDAAVIGAGPAGAAAARRIAASGGRVVVLEAKRRVGDRPHCAEYVPAALALEVDFPPRSVVQSVEGMETRLAGESTVVKAPGFILDRGRFDFGLAEAAADAGAEFRTAARVTDLTDDGLTYRLGGRSLYLKPRLILAADGAASTVRRLLGLTRTVILSGPQLTVPLTAPLDRTRVWLDPDYYQGYAWLFPRGEAANLGLGMVERRPGEARDRLAALRDRLISDGLIRPGRLGVSQGAIALSPVTLKWGANILFLGDAAGLTHPVTGAGIPQAVFSGLAAGASVACYLSEGDPADLAAYEREVRGRFQRSHKWALDRRALLMGRWGEDDFYGLMRKTWPAFREYRRP
jgi:geranylgeranyl reductase family protein